MHNNYFSILNMNKHGNIYFTLLTGLILVLFTSNLSAQNNEIIAINKAFENSEWGKLVNHCQETIRLSVDQTQGNFSNTQARYILADFFKKHPIFKIKIIKSDKISEDLFFSILQSETENKTFNIYYTIQEKEDSYLISEIQIKEKSK